MHFKFTLLSNYLILRRYEENGSIYSFLSLKLNQ